MSRISLRYSRLRHHEGGFSLIELMVALTVLALVMAAGATLLVATARADQLSSFTTQAKNLNAGRVSAMQGLPFHVAHQNGSYIDLLDDYYTNVSAAASAIPATGGSGQYVASGIVPGQSRTGPFYQVTFAGSVLPNGFSQVVYTQFLAPNTQSGAAGATIVTPPASYDSQTTGNDSPPSLLVGVTVVTTYKTGSAAHSLRTTTEITDVGHDAALVLAQAGATALTVDSRTSDGSQLAAILGQVGADATLSNESSAGATAQAASFARTDPNGTITYTPVQGATGSAYSPPAPATTSVGSVSAVSAPPVLSGNCGWGSANPTSAGDVSATVAGAQPRVPADVETTPAPSVTTTLSANGGGGRCGAFAFSNELPGSTAVTALASTTNPNFVLIPDAAGNGALVSSSASADTPSLAAHLPVATTAAITYAQPIELFPGTSFVTDATYGHAPVVILPTSVSISCSSTTGGASASYNVTVKVWQTQSSTGSGGYVTYGTTGGAWTGGAAPSLPAPATTVVTYATGAPTYLSTYINTWTFNTLIEQTSSGSVNLGDHTVPAALTVDTAPTLADASGAANANSDLAISVGRISCVAQDAR